MYWIVKYSRINLNVFVQSDAVLRSRNYMMTALASLFPLVGFVPTSVLNVLLLF